jgi:hypothetical protein
MYSFLVNMFTHVLDHLYTILLKRLAEVPWWLTNPPHWHCLSAMTTAAVKVMLLVYTPPFIKKQKVLHVLLNDIPMTLHVTSRPMHNGKVLQVHWLSYGIRTFKFLLIILNIYICNPYTIH